jgi:hypothetical protein
VFGHGGDQSNPDHRQRAAGLKRDAREARDAEQLIRAKAVSDQRQRSDRQHQDRQAVCRAPRARPAGGEHQCDADDQIGD